jgi:hypothetical protein
VKRGYPTLAELFRAGDVVESLLDHPGWVVVQSLLSRERSEIDARLNGSKPLEHVEYAHMHGQLRGLNASMDAALAVRDHAAAVRREQELKHEGAGESVPGR